MTKKGVARVSVGCPANERSGPCTGTLKLKTSERVKVGRDRKRVALGTADFEIAAGQSKPVAIKLSRGNRDLVEDLRKVAVDATATARDALKNAATARRSFTLKAP